MASQVGWHRGLKLSSLRGREFLLLEKHHEVTKALRETSKLVLSNL